MRLNEPIPDVLTWVSIDLDGCLAESVWPELGIGEPIDRNVEQLIEVYKAGYNIMIHTSRHWGDYAMIEKWLDIHNIPYKMIVCGKPLVHRYFDDKAVNSAEESWINHL